MLFIKIPDFKGRVFVPERRGTGKHNCPDCYSCLYCSDERCDLCLSRNCPECEAIDRAKGEDFHTD